MSNNETENSIKISYSCKKCLKLIEFFIKKDEFRIEDFPIQLDNIHGDPPHQLIVNIDNTYNVNSFEIIENIKKEIPISFNYTRALFYSFGLNEKEINLHSISSGLGPLTLGAIALLSHLNLTECEESIIKLTKCGFFKEIPGAKKYYQALPPYAALISQIEVFGKFLSSTKNNTTIELQTSFNNVIDQVSGLKNIKDFAEYISKLKQEITRKLLNESESLSKSLTYLNQEKNINAISNLQEQSKSLLDVQFEAIDHQVMGSLDVFDTVFTGLSQKLDKSADLIVQQVSNLNSQLSSLQGKISEKIGLLRLGIIQETVDEVIGNIFQSEMESIRETFKSQYLKNFQDFFKDLKNSFEDQLRKPIQFILEKSKESFEKDFSVPLKDHIQKVFQQINNSTKEASKIGTELQRTFSDVKQDFYSMITESELKIYEITEDISETFSHLKQIFNQRVIETLNTVLVDIMDNLSLSNLTIEEFWEESKRNISFSMKDVWFIRTPEGMISQINDSILNSKMRILVVCPTLDDIIIDPLFQIPNHINIRICCNIDTNKPTHKEKMDYFASKPNITLRNRDLQNLWAINRDYEEVVLGIVNKITIENKSNYEIVGIGSALQEHIKILVPILEEAWMGSKKDIMYQPKAMTPTIIETAKKMVSPIIDNKVSPAEEIKDTSVIIDQIDSILKQLPENNIKKIYESLQKLEDLIIKIIGYSSRLIEIKNWIKKVQNLESLDKITYNHLSNWLKSCKNKLT